MTATLHSDLRNDFFSGRIYFSYILFGLLVPFSIWFSFSIWTFLFPFLFGLLFSLIYLDFFPHFFTFLPFYIIFHSIILNFFQIFKWILLITLIWFNLWMYLTQSHTQIDVKQEKTSTCLNKSRIFLTSNVARMINDFFFTRTEVIPIQYFPSSCFKITVFSSWFYTWNVGKYYTIFI